MTPLEFAVLANLLKQEMGLLLGPEKQYLAESRLVQIMQRHQLRDTADLLSQIRSGDPSLLTEVCEAMTTNETSFFRDGRPFDVFQNYVLPRLTKRTTENQTLRILSCAASTGQEAYSISMCIQDNIHAVRGWHFEIVGIDVNQSVLDKARSGIYSGYEVKRGLPNSMRARHLTRTNNGWIVDQRLRQRVAFIRHNILDSLVKLGRFDVVFCRNVLIYFDIPTRSKALENIVRVIRPDGFLFLGSSETPVGVSDRFLPSAHERGVYECAPGLGVAEPRPERTPFAKSAAAL